LRPVMPNAVFFTVDLDARLLEPEQLKWTRNVIVGSHFGLSLNRASLQDVAPPFRDAYQSSLFLATRLALSCWKQDAQEPLLPQSLIESPQVFEIGRTMAVDLSRPWSAGKSDDKKRRAMMEIKELQKKCEPFERLTESAKRYEVNFPTLHNFVQSSLRKIH